MNLYLWWQFSSSSSSSVGVRLSRIQSLVSLRSETPSSCPVLPFPSPDLNRKQQQRYITQLRYHDRRLLFKRGNGRSYTLFLGNSSNTSPVSYMLSSWAELKCSSLWAFMLWWTEGFRFYIPSVSSTPFVSFLTLFFLCFAAGTSPLQDDKERKVKSNQEIQCEKNSQYKSQFLHFKTWLTSCVLTSCFHTSDKREKKKSSCSAQILSIKMTSQQRGNTSTYLGIVGSDRCPRWRDKKRSLLSLCVHFHSLTPDLIHLST